MPKLHDLLVPGMEQWKNMTLNHPDGEVVLDGVGFSAIGRLELLQILQGQAEALGVELNFGCTIASVDELSADLIIGADGLNSLVRSSNPEAFGYRVEEMNNRFAWFGTHKSFDTLTQTFVNHPKGALNAHHYRYSKDMSTFIVEVEESGFEGHGFASMDENESAAYCAELFADVLGGEALVTNKSIWRRFPKLWCDRWVSGNMALCWVMRFTLRIFPLAREPALRWKTRLHLSLRSRHLQQCCRRAGTLSANPRSNCRKDRHCG